MVDSSVEYEVTKYGQARESAPIRGLMGYAVVDMFQHP
jgi:hypothetical protein